MLVASRNGLGIAVNEIQRSLGDVPNDFEAGWDLQYTPVRQGWYVGYPVTGGGYDSRGQCPSGFGDDGSAAAAAAVAVPPIVPAPDPNAARVEQREQLRTALQVVGTVSAVIVATAFLIKAIRGEGHHVLGSRHRRRRY